MRNPAERVFWSIVLLLQIGAMTIDLGLNPLGSSLLLDISALCSLATAGLVLQRRIFRHNFWAGLVGVVFPYGAFMALALVATSGLALLAPDFSPGRADPVIVAAMLVQLLTFAAPFFYVFGSPHIWAGDDLAPDARCPR